MNKKSSLIITVITFIFFGLIANSAIAATWIAEAVDSAGDVGKYTSIAIDSLDNMHISYWDESNDDLKYATNASGSWVTETVYSYGRVGYYTSIAIDSSDNVHISCYGNGLMYATNASGSWVTETLQLNGAVGYTSIAIDSSDNVHISYWVDNYPNSHLWYATNASGIWVFEAVDSARQVGKYSSIAIDSSDNVHISYYDDTNYDLKYATNASGSWVTETVDSTGSVGQYTSIAIDSLDNVHISYHSYNDLKYATNASGSWVTEMLDSTVIFGQYTSIAIDSLDNVHISYYGYPNWDLMYATNASGSWVNETLDSTGMVGHYTSIAIDSLDNVHISYYDISNLDLKYATNAPLVEIDNDNDGYNSVTDCNDAASSCTTDCSTDSDSDGVIDCLDLCTDNDTDNYGTDESTTVIGGGSIPVGSCTINGATPCTFGDNICLDTDCDDNDGNNYPGNAEVCDAQDNNCDGSVDETFDVGTACDNGQLGECLNSGTKICDGPNDTVCDAPDGSGNAEPEVCEDNLDNDCDGTIDNGCICTVGETLNCGSNVGECEFGAETCIDGLAWGACIGGQGPVAEICDGLDNNCDGPIDEGYVTTTTNCGTGVCASTGLMTCQNGTEVDTCIVGTPTEDPESTCNDGLDNDCNGDTDEGDSDCISVPTSIQLPKTGQTTCYDSNGTIIPCAGTGQDGDIQAGVAWPNPRFTSNADTSVTDNLTGLVWAPDGNLLPVRDPGWDTDWTENDGAVTWEHALDYVAKLNAENYLGHNDWRLPNINEIESLINVDDLESDTWLNTQGFNNVQSGEYWSSTSHTTFTSASWRVSMRSADGYMDTYQKNGNIYVWPVRSGQSGSFDYAAIWRTGQTTSYYGGDDGDLEMGIAWPEQRFSDNGAVTDNLTGLMWLKNANCIMTEYPALAIDGLVTWQGALDFVKGINNGTYSNCGAGHNDWRLPNRKELRSLIDYSNYDSALPDSHPFINVQLGYYRSSTTITNYANLSWEVSMLNGWLEGGSKNGFYPVWPVRGAEVDALDSDSDGVPDIIDNCECVANEFQIDTDGDGYGNRCDADLNNDGTVNAPDFGMFAFTYGLCEGDENYNPDANLTADSGDVCVNAPDFGLFAYYYSNPVGYCE